MGHPPIRAQRSRVPDGSAPGAVPVPLTSFLGRDQEIAAITAFLHRTDGRLLTLTGPGGVGKTRLVIRALRLLQEDSAFDITYIPFAQVRDAGLFLTTVAGALGLPDDSPPVLLDHLRTTSGGQAPILVLDNLEHLVDGIAPILSGLLVQCPELRVVATSRVRLGVSGEQVMPVAPLDRETARDLFVARAQATDPSFSAVPGIAPSLDQICDRVDRLPLAIELAAARVSVLPPAALLSRLDRRLDLLSGGPRDVDPRQRGMRNAIAWSHDLLPEPQQALLRRVGVFAGGFTLEAAEALSGDGNEVLDDLTGLVMANLIQPVPGIAGESRFTMLETIREYGLEQLDASGEEPMIRDRHARHMVSLAEFLWETADEGIAVLGMQRLRPEVDNIRLALHWMLEHEPAGALRLAGALLDFWIVFDHITEGRTWLERTLEAADAAPSQYRTRALVAAAWLALGQFDFPTADAAAAEAAIAPVESERLRYKMLEVPRLMALHRGDLDRARQLFTEERERAAHDGPPWQEAVAVMNLGQVALQAGDLTLARNLLERALALHRVGSPPLGVAFGQVYLAQLELESDRSDQAFRHFCDAFPVFADLGHVGMATFVLESMARAIVSTHPAIAARLLGMAASFPTQAEAIRSVDDARTYVLTGDTARSRLGESEFTAAWNEGMQCDWDEIRAEVNELSTRLRGSIQVDSSNERHHGLSPRELDVLRLVATGCSNREIADALSISVPTVKRHITTILGKLDLPSRTAAAAWAHTHGALA